MQFARKTILLIILLMLMTTILNAKIIIIINKGSDIKVLPKPAAKAIFMGELKSLKGIDELVVTIQSDTDSHSGFLQEYIGSTSSDFKKHWEKMIYTGKAMEPEVMNSDQEVIDYVKANKGAIGYIDVKSLDDSVKAVMVN